MPALGYLHESGAGDSFCEFARAQRVDKAAGPDIGDMNAWFARL